MQHKTLVNEKYSTVFIIKHTQTHIRNIAQQHHQLCMRLFEQSSMHSTHDEALKLPYLHILHTCISMEKNCNIVKIQTETT